MKKTKIGMLTVASLLLFSHSASAGLVSSVKIEIADFFATSPHPDLLSIYPSCTVSNYMQNGKRVASSGSFNPSFNSNHSFKMSLSLEKKFMTPVDLNGAYYQCRIITKDKNGRLVQAGKAGTGVAKAINCIPSTGEGGACVVSGKF